MEWKANLTVDPDIPMPDMDFSILNRSNLVRNCITTHASMHFA